MPLVATPAVILATLRYSESSKIVRLATRDHGVQSVIAKGALRPRSRFGAALQTLSSGQAQFLLSDRRDLHTLTAFDVTVLRVGLSAEVSRYATAVALAEVMLRVAPAEPHPEAFEVLEDALGLLEHGASAQVPALAPRSLWRLVGALGFAPSLTACARDGTPLPSRGTMHFSTSEGGALCEQCARSVEVVQLEDEAAKALAALADPGAPLPLFDARHAAAHRRLVTRYIRHHLSEGGALPALDFWQSRAWATP
jgi:DNA repair protein RecO (recombination protein O)